MDGIVNNRQYDLWQLGIFSWCAVIAARLDVILVSYVPSDKCLAKIEGGMKKKIQPVQFLIFFLFNNLFTK